MIHLIIKKPFDVSLERLLQLNAIHGHVGLSYSATIAYDSSWQINNEEESRKLWRPRKGLDILCIYGS